MGISYAVPTKYEFDYFYGATNIVFAGPSSIPLTVTNINPVDLLGFRRKGQLVELPETQGGVFLTDGYQAPVTMDLSGEAAGDNAHDTWNTLRARLSRLVHGGGYKYLRMGLHDGTSKLYYRRYVEPDSGGGRYARRTQYEACSGIEVSLHCYDPSWYAETVSSDSIVVSAGTSGSKVITDNGDWRTNRFLVFVTRSGATPTNITLSNLAGESMTMTGTLPTNGDFWEIDMFNGTVKKSVSSVVSNDIGNFSGRFLSVNRLTDTITFTSTVSCSVTVSLLWLPRFT